MPQNSLFRFLKGGGVVDAEIGIDSDVQGHLYNVSS